MRQFHEHTCQIAVKITHLLQACETAALSLEAERTHVEAKTASEEPLIFVVIVEYITLPVLFVVFLWSVLFLSMVLTVTNDMASKHVCK